MSSQKPRASTTTTTRIQIHHISRSLPRSTPLFLPAATQVKGDNPSSWGVSAARAGSQRSTIGGSTMSMPALLEEDVTQSLRQLAQQLRVDSVRCSTAASSGHPTSALSAADLMAVLLARHLRYDFGHPDAP